MCGGRDQSKDVLSSLNNMKARPISPVQTKKNGPTTTPTSSNPSNPAPTSSKKQKSKKATSPTTSDVLHISTSSKDNKISAITSTSPHSPQDDDHRFVSFRQLDRMTSFGTLSGKKVLLAATVPANITGDSNATGVKIDENISRKGRNRVPRDSTLSTSQQMESVSERSDSLSSGSRSRSRTPPPVAAGRTARRRSIEHVPGRKKSKSPDDAHALRLSTRRSSNPPSEASVSDHIESVDPSRPQKGDFWDGKDNTFKKFYGSSTGQSGSISVKEAAVKKAQYWKESKSLANRQLISAYDDEPCLSNKIELSDATLSPVVTKQSIKTPVQAMPLAAKHNELIVG